MSDAMQALLIRGAAAMGLSLSGAEVNALSRYGEELIRWNATVNLTGLTDESAIAEKHFLDSLACWRGGWIENGARLIDVGSGGGFPGLVLKITSARLPAGVGVTLLESSARKVAFLEHICKVLAPSGANVVHGRAEELGREVGYREGFDVAVARAVAGLSTISEYCLPFLRQGGWFLAMKGPMAEDEVNRAGRAIETLGGRVAGITWYTLPFCGQRRAIVAVRKISECPIRYPRRAGIPAKRPL